MEAVSSIAESSQFFDLRFILNDQSKKLEIHPHLRCSLPSASLAITMRLHRRAIHVLPD